MMSNERFFSEYRPHDYRTPRSAREAFGYDVDLYEGDRLAHTTQKESYILYLLVNAIVWVSCIISVSYVVYQSIK